MESLFGTIKTKSLHHYRFKTKPRGESLNIIKFTGTFEDLKSKLQPLSGMWDDSQPNKKVLRLDGGVLNWYESTGTINTQGKSPGKEFLDEQVPNLLYPKEFPKPSILEKTVVIEEKNQTSPIPETSIEHLYLTNGIETSELVLGLVYSVGTESTRVIDDLRNRLSGFGYEIQEIRASELLPKPTSSENEYDRIKHYMNEGDELRKNSNNNAILAAGVISKIKSLRNNLKPKTAYVVNSLKHPSEVEFLRKVYGQGFYLFGIHAEEKRRHDYLVSDKSLTQNQASELIRIDEDEKIPHGQRTRDTFHLSDFFINLGKNTDYVKNTIQRFLELIFANPYKNPTFDEFSMFMAFNSSIRSSDLSRQVGAIIAKNEQIIATGANDCPKYGGGQYWAEVNDDGEVNDYPDGKDYTREEDSNKVAQNEIIDEISNAIINSQLTSDKQKLIEILQQSKISDLTEFGRVVHAEMEALLSCAREGIATIGASLYCTTFPCHNCAKHIIDAGINRVVYVEPYPKSRALEFHNDSIELKTRSDESDANPQLVKFEPFTGVGARRFLELFSMNLGSGTKLKRKDSEGNTVVWDKAQSKARTPLIPRSYIDIEIAANEIWDQSQNSV